MRKTIEDLRLGDKVYYMKNQSVRSIELTEMSRQKYVFEDYTLNFEEGDLKRFVFEAEHKYGRYEAFWLEKVYALQALKSHSRNYVLTGLKEIEKRCDVIAEDVIRMQKLDREILRELKNQNS